MISLIFIPRKPCSAMIIKYSVFPAKVFGTRKLRHSDFRLRHSWGNPRSAEIYPSIFRLCDSFPRQFAN